MREIEFGLWANEQTLFAPIFMIVGAIISVVGDWAYKEELLENTFRAFSSMAFRACRRHFVPFGQLNDNEKRMGLRSIFSAQKASLEGVFISAS